MVGVPKIQYFESLRGFAALIVVLRHGDFVQGSPLTVGFITGQSYLMVDFFFVLSGWVIALNYDHRINTARDIIHFQAKRLLRLYPLHIATLFLALGIELLRYYAETRMGLEAHYPAFDLNDAYHFFLNLFFMQVPFGHHISWNIPSWSISAEVFTYMVFALIVYFGRTWKYVLMAAAAAFSFILLMPYYDNFNQSVGFPPLLRCIMAFMMGSLAQRISANYRLNLPPVLDYIALIGTVFLLCFNHLLIDMIYPFVFVAVLFVLTQTRASGAKRILETKWLVYLGTISYGIYMLHSAVWWFLSNIIRTVFKPDMVHVDGNHFQMALGPVAGLAVHLTGLAITIVAAGLSYRYLERPMNNLRHKYLKNTNPKPRIPAVDAAPAST